MKRCSTPALTRGTFPWRLYWRLALIFPGAQKISMVCADIWLHINPLSPWLHTLFILTLQMIWTLLFISVCRHTYVCAFLSASVQGTTFPTLFYREPKLRTRPEECGQCKQKDMHKISVSTRSHNNAHPVFGNNTRVMLHLCSSSCYNYGTVYIGSGCFPIGIFGRVMFFMLLCSDYSGSVFQFL